MRNVNGTALHASRDSAVPEGWAAQGLPRRRRVVGLHGQEPEIAAAVAELPAGPGELLRAVGAHPGGDVGVGVAAAALGKPEQEAIARFEALVEARLAQQVAPVCGERQYRLPRAVHAVAVGLAHSSREAEPHEHQALVRRIGAYYTDAARRAAGFLPPGEQRTDAATSRGLPGDAWGVEWLRHHRGVLHALIDAPESPPEVVAGLVDALWGSWDLCDHADQALVAHDRAVAAARTVGDPVLLGRLLTASGVLRLRAKTDADRVLELLDEARYWCARGGATVQAAVAQAHQGVALRGWGRLEEAREALLRASTAALHGGAREWAGRILLALADGAQQDGDLHEATSHAAVAAELLQDDPVLAASAHARWARDETALGNNARAGAVLAAGRDRLLGSDCCDEAAARVWLQLGDVWRDRGDCEQALACYEQARDRARECHALMLTVAVALRIEGLSVPDAAVRGES